MVVGVFSAAAEAPEVEVDEVTSILLAFPLFFLLRTGGIDFYNKFFIIQTFCQATTRDKPCRPFHLTSGCVPSALFHLASC